MTLEVIWSNRAEDSFEEIVKQIEGKWTNKEVSNFLKRCNKTILSISNHPYIFQATQLPNVRKAVVSKQTSIIYEIRESQIVILLFWDNRQEPVIG